MSPDQDDYLDDDAGAGRPETRGVLAAGWLRALLVLAALAVVLVVTVPYFIEWIAPEPRPAARPSLLEPPKTDTAMMQGSATAPAAASPAPASAAMAVKPEPAPKPEAPLRSEPAPKLEPSKSEPAAKAESPVKPVAAAAKDTVPTRLAAKPMPTAARAAEPAAAAKPARPAMAPAVTPGGDYWVQVGLFASSDNADRLAKELRDERFAVEIVQTTRGAATAAPVSRHEVLVEGASVEAVTAALKGAGTAEAAGSAVVVRPAMDLKDAVALSRRLSGDGLQVRIRRVGEATGSGSTVYVVRVGGYATKEAAAAGKRDLAAKGVGGFVTQGAPR